MTERRKMNMTKVQLIDALIERLYAGVGIARQANVRRAYQRMTKTDIETLLKMVTK